MWETLIGAAVAGGIAALTGRPAEDVVAAAASGATAGYLLGEAGAAPAGQNACLSDVIEYLVVTGDAKKVDFAPGGAKVSLAVPSAAAGASAVASLLRCNPKRAYYNAYTNKAIAEF